MSRLAINGPLEGLTVQAFNTSDLIERIRRHQEAHPELLRSHHFVFDCPLDRSYKGKPDFVWFGVNPGDDEDDWKRDKKNREESRDYDFQVELGRSKASAARMKYLRDFLGDEMFRRTTHCELFFWGSKDTDRAFEDRYDYGFDNSPHWDFCCKINLELLQRAQPRAVFAEGRRLMRHYERRLGLLPGRQHRSANGELLIEERRLESGAPFFCFDHQRARIGWIQRCRIRNRLHLLVSKLPEPSLPDDKQGAGSDDFGFRPFPKRGAVVTNELINRLRADAGD